MVPLGTGPSGTETVMSSKTTTQTIDAKLLRDGYWEFFAVLLGYGHTIKQFALFTQLDLVAEAVAGVLTVMFVMGFSVSLAPVVIALVTFGVYVGDRISDIKREPEASSDRSAFMKRHETVLSVASATSYGLAIAISAFGGPLALAITLVPGVGWILYASDLTAGLSPSIPRLKRVAVLNSSIVGAAGAVAIVLLPISFANARVGPTALALLAYFFLDIFIGTEVPNFRDMADDAKNDVQTLPLRYGVTRTRHIIYSINVLIVAVLLFAFTSNLFGVAFLGAALLGRGYAVGLHSFIGRTDRYRLLELLGEMKHVLVAVVFAGLLFT